MPLIVLAIGGLVVRSLSATNRPPLITDTMALAKFDTTAAASADNVRVVVAPPYIATASGAAAADFTLATPATLPMSATRPMSEVTAAEVVVPEDTTATAGAPHVDPQRANKQLQEENVEENNYAEPYPCKYPICNLNAAAEEIVEKASSRGCALDDGDIVVFQDMHDGDQKQVTLEDGRLSILPYANNVCASALSPCRVVSALYVPLRSHIVVLSLLSMCLCALTLSCCLCSHTVSCAGDMDNLL